MRDLVSAIDGSGSIAEENFDIEMLVMDFSDAFLTLKLAKEEHLGSSRQSRGLLPSTRLLPFR